MKAEVGLLVLAASLTAASCGAEETAACRFPVEFVIADGNTLSYVSGDTQVEWIAGDHVKLDVIADTLRVNGLAHYPTPESEQVLSEERLQELYGDVPFVRSAVANLVKEETPWRVAAALFHERTREIERRAGEQYVSTRSIQAAKAVLQESSLISRVEATMYDDLPVLEYWFEGLRIGGRSVPTILELRETMEPTMEWPRPFDPKLACSIARRLERHLTDARVANRMILKGGNLEDHGRVVSGSD